MTPFAPTFIQPIHMKLIQSHPRHLSLRRTTGLSLIELLVSMAIGLIVTLAITTVMVRSEGQQRTSTAVNDATQAGAYSSLTLDRAIRSAGSGFTQFKPALGCLINAGSGATTILPPAAALPAPFANIGTAAVPVTLAPAVIVDGGASGSDQLIVMSGTHGFSEVPRTITPGSVAVASLSVNSTMGMQEGDLVLVAGGVAGDPCMVQQVGAVTAGSVSLPLAGTYFDSAGATTTLVSYGTNANLAKRASVIPLGSMGVPGVRPANPPSMFAYGIDSNSNLVAYDLLNTTGTAPVSISEGVVAMQALYGIGTPTALAGTTPTTPTPLVWTAPTAATGYSATAAGLLGAAGQALFPNIQAIRVALIMRSTEKEKNPVYPSATNLTMFPDIPALQVSFPIAGDDLNYRYRIVDTVIPIRNF